MSTKKITVTISYEDGNTRSFSGIEEKFAVNRDIYFSEPKGSELSRLTPSDQTHYYLHVIEEDPANEEGKSLRLAGA